MAMALLFGGLLGLETKPAAGTVQGPERTPCFSRRPAPAGAPGIVYLPRKKKKKN